MTGARERDGKPNAVAGRAIARPYLRRDVVGRRGGAATTDA